MFVAIIIPDRLHISSSQLCSYFLNFIFIYDSFRFAFRTSDGMEISTIPGRTWALDMARKKFFSPLKKFRWFRCSMRFEVIGYISHLICRLSSYASGLQCCFIVLSQLSIHLSVNFSKYLMLRSLYLFYWLCFGVDWDILHFAWFFFFSILWLFLYSSFGCCVCFLFIESSLCVLESCLIRLLELIWLTHCWVLAGGNFPSSFIHKSVKRSVSIEFHGLSTGTSFDSISLSLDSLVLSHHVCIFISFFFFKYRKDLSLSRELFYSLILFLFIVCDFALLTFMHKNTSQ